MFIVLRAMFIIFGLISMIKQFFDLVYGFLHLKYIIKQLLDDIFGICRIINVKIRISYIDIGNSAHHKNLIQ